MRRRSEAGGRKSVQAATYLSASMQFEQRHRKSSLTGAVVECEGSVLRGSIPKSEHEINESCSQIDRARSLIKVRI